MGFDYPTDTKLHLRGAKEIIMTHFLNTDDFKGMLPHSRELLKDQLAAAKEAGEFVSVRVDDDWPNIFDVCTMGEDAAHEYNATGGGWTYVHPAEVLAELQ